MTRNPHYRALLSKQAWGGALHKTRAGRKGYRPLAIGHSLHLVLRSSAARGACSFWRPQHKRQIQFLVKKFSERHGLRVFSMANVGNHLHMHVRVPHRRGYLRFIRGLSAAIEMAVTKNSATPRKRFWDQRPFSRVVFGRRAFARVQDYVDLNHLEATGLNRANARYWLAREQDLRDGAYWIRENPPDD